jgi:hypothetical protein
VIAPASRACMRAAARTSAPNCDRGARGVLVCIMRRLGQYTLKKAHLVPTPVAVKGEPKLRAAGDDDLRHDEHAKVIEQVQNR